LDRIIQTRRFGAHRVGLLESIEDDGAATYSVLVDDVVVTDPPLDRMPGFEDLVRIYARSQEAAGGGPR